MKRRSKVKCFKCGDEFSRKEDIFRDRADKNKPYCKECFSEILSCRQNTAEFGEYTGHMLSCKNYVNCLRAGCDPENCEDYEEEE